MKLPHVTSSSKWYTQSGYNQHSRIMYYFMCSNEMVSLDLKYQQTTKYTYFCIKSGVYTWIDHVLSTNYDTENVQSCCIEPLIDNNVSDHLPISMVYRVQVPTAKTTPSQKRPQQSHPIINEYSMCVILGTRD